MKYRVRFTLRSNRLIPTKIATQIAGLRRRLVRPEVRTSSSKGGAHKRVYSTSTHGEPGARSIDLYIFNAGSRGGMSNIPHKELSGVVARTLPYLPSFTLPAALHISVVPKSSKMGYFSHNVLEGTIQVPLREKENAPPNDRDAGLVHELGHAVLWSNVARILPPMAAVGDLVSARVYWTHIDHQLLPHMVEATRRRFASTPQTADKTAAGNNLLALGDDIGEVLMALDEECAETVETARVLMSPYQELFSDLLAVIVYDDPAIMSKDGYRDFTRVFADAEVETWNPSNTHYTLDPVRSYLYSAFLSTHLDLTTKRSLLVAVFEAMTAELGPLYESRSNRTLSSAEMNRGMIARLASVSIT